MTRFFALLTATLALTSCASILQRSTQEVSFLTPGAHDSICLVDNGETVYRVLPPQTVTLSKRSHDLKVHCMADGNREKTVVFDPDTQDIALANVFTGFVPGMYYDHESGALYAYPGTIIVDFTDMPAQAMPLPNYEQHIAENPHLFGMEEFHPGDPALLRDKYDTSEPLKKREFPGGGTIMGETAAEDAGEGAAVESETLPAPAGEPASESTGSSAIANPATDMISDLTRQMNPHVFGPAQSEPVPIHPDEIK